MKIFHTADVHLGLKFGSYPEDLAARLSEARFETLRRMVELANQERCDLFAVGGDLFDNLRVAQRDISRAAKILGQFDGLSVVLPGNHDYVTNQDDDIWKVFQSTLQDRVLVLAERRMYSLKPFDLDACLYAAPCQNKHSKSHAVGWIQDSPKNSEHRFQIGLAHGSFEGLTPDTEGDYYPMKKEDLIRCGLDLWLMGHIHVQFPVRPGAADRIFYPATPEPDGFDCRHEGKAWIIELSEVDGEKRISPRSVSTGTYRFHHESVKIDQLEDLEVLKSRFSANSYSKMLLKLAFTGSLRKEAYSQLATQVAALKENFLYLLPDHSSVTVRMTSDDIDREFVAESFPHRLLGELARTQGDEEALQLAYDLIRETRASASGTKAL